MKPRLTPPLDTFSRKSVAKKIAFYLLIIGVTCLCSWLSNLYLFPNLDVSFLCLYSGLIIGLLYRLGRAATLPLFLGLVLYFVFSFKTSMAVALWTSATTLVSGWMAIFYLRKFIITDITKRPFFHLIHFYIAGLLIAPVTHTFLDLPLVFFSSLTLSFADIRSYIFPYLFGEAFGALVLSPAIIFFGIDFSDLSDEAFADPATTRLEKILWSCLAFFLLISTVLYGERYFYSGILDVEFFLYPMLLWSGLRLGIVFTSMVIAIISIVVFSFPFFGIAGSPTATDIRMTVHLLLMVITLAVMSQIISVITLEWRRNAKRLLYRASHHPATGLPNLRAFNRSITQINQSKKEAVQYEMGFVSLCNHEPLVQGYGFKARNSLFTQFGAFLKMELNDQGRIYQVEGPSFAILFPNAHGESCRKLMGELTERIKQFQFIWRNRPYRINATLSLTTVKKYERRGDLLVARASALADQAFSRGSIGTLILDEDRSSVDRYQTQAIWMDRLTTALDHDGFVLMGQLIAPLSGGRSVESGLHFEVLLRMKNEDDSLYAPGQFMPHAEYFKLMPNIDRWVINKVFWLLADICSSATVDNSFSTCAINLSGESFNDPEMLEFIRLTLAATGAPVDKICFEITETAAIANMHRAIIFVKELRKMGFSTSLDDFGSGFASFDYLKKLPVDTIKIDGSFVKDMLNSEIDYLIIESIKRIARSMNLEIIAEFVENAEIMKALEKLGIDYVQGYHIGKPVRIEELLF